MENIHLNSQSKISILVRYSVFLLSLFFSLSYYTSISQGVSEIGLPYIQNYSPDEYGAFDQNWETVQDSLGILYFANGDGVLSYNGSEWGLVELPNKAPVFSLGIGTNGKIYVGAIGEFGYLKANANGQLNYNSLISKLPKKYDDFGEIRAICTTNNGVYFGSKKYIFKLDGESFEVIENSGDTSFYLVNDILFKRIKGKGLMQLKNKTLELMPSGEFFSNDKIYSILPYHQNEFLIATRNQLYIYNGQTIDVFKTNATSFFEDNIIYKGLQLNDGSYAIASLYKGILLLDSEGQQNIILSQDGLLQSNMVYGLFQDQTGLLWAALQSGISKIEPLSPYTYFNRYNGAPDMVFDIDRFNERLYLGGPEGLFYLKNESGIHRFHQTKENFGMVWDILRFRDKLLIGSADTIYQINENGSFENLFEGKSFNQKVSSLYQSKINPDRIFIATNSGVATMLYQNNTWTLSYPFEGIDFFIDRIIETPEGSLWLGTDKNEVVRISFANLGAARNLANPVVKIFKPKDGLPDAIGKPYLIQDQFYFASDYQVYKFNTKDQNFINDKELLLKLGLSDQKVKINYVDEKGQVGLISYKDENRLNQMIAAPKKDGSYSLFTLDEQRIIAMKKFGVYTDFSDSILWYKGRKGVIRYDLKSKLESNTKRSKAIISKVFYKNDSLLFGGYTSSITKQLPFKNNQLRFEFANPSFYDEAKNQFQYILEGFDEDWSSLSLETKKDYTNIPEGHYTFKIRSRNIFNELSNADRYSFTIIAPWYRSWWAYLLYLFGGIALVSLLLQWRSKELRTRNTNLEATINKRTLEIRQKNELLHHQTEQLIELSDSKTKLYSNITHEFRTPLTVILGMAEALKNNVANKSFEGAYTSLEMIRRNGKNLLQLVNEMLDLAKVESGAMELNLVQTDVVPLVKYLSESFHSLAEAKKINLTVYSEIEALEMDVDVNKMASIMSNLLSNAIKFTRANGKIIVHLNTIKTKDRAVFSIKLQDNGLGLAVDDITHLFDRFYQVENASSPKQAGTGIGLSLAKEFVELMNGTISVESTLGKGSTFTVQLPVSNTAEKKVDSKINVVPSLKKATHFPSAISTDIEETSALPLALIIEDNEDVAHYLKTCLKGKYKTIHAINGNIGVEMAYEHIPDIIISDVMMPGKDGFEVCANLKSDGRTDHIPIILLTAKITAEDRLIGLSNGADAYLAKPFNERELFIRLDQLVLLRKKLVDKIQKDGVTDFLDIRVESPESKFLQKVIQFVNDDIGNSAFGSSDLADKLHLSESQIYRKLKAITDKSTAVFIRSIRLQKAKEMIQTSDKTISEIAYETGFNDPSWFSRAFKDEFGAAPSDIHK